MSRHQYKNLIINLPDNWRYEAEQNETEACFNPESQSTFRIHIIQAEPPKNLLMKEKIVTATNGLEYSITDNGYYLTKIRRSEALEKDTELSMFSWRLIELFDDRANIAVLTYTVLSTEKESVEETKIIKELENSIKKSVFI